MIKNQFLVDICFYLKKQITLWLYETPLYLYELFYENAGTEIEFANLEPVGQLDLSQKITVGKLLELYDGRELPSCRMPGGWEYPTIGDDLQDVIDDVVKRIAIECIELNLSEISYENFLEIIQNQFRIYLDFYDKKEVAEAIYMELKDSLNNISSDIFQTFLELYQDDLI